ncbi:MAG: hypothetical protein NZ585_04295 [Chloracidobacterium sp.]|nr:hypothetical protein [Chloracidobacterium sp.]MDW8218574.1 hypothetical protein [Acidobacteriota bacterium]
MRLRSAAPLAAPEKMELFVRDARADNVLEATVAGDRCAGEVYSFEPTFSINRIFGICRLARLEQA